MTANDIYKLKPISVTTEIDRLIGCGYNHIPEIDAYYLGYVSNERINIKTYADYCFDGRRIWKISSVWFDEKPVMIIQNAGREGDDHAERFITDTDVYENMVSYIKTLMAKEELPDVIDPDENIPKLTGFYGHTLGEFYDPNFVPVHKIGDVVEVNITNNSLRYYELKCNEYRKMKVQITHVFNIPCRTYLAKDLEEKHSPFWVNYNLEAVD